MTAMALMASMSVGGVLVPSLSGGGMARVGTFKGPGAILVLVLIDGQENLERHNQGRVASSC